jgi:AraC-like DNA-binding protein
MNLPAELRIDDVQAWRRMSEESFGPLECQPSPLRRFAVSALVARFSDCLAAELCVSESRVLRHRRMAENAEAAYFKLVWQLSGRSQVAQGPNQGLLEPGQWAVYDTTRAYSIASSDRSRFLVLMVPQRESLGWSPAVNALAGRALDGGGAPRIVLSGLAAMLRDGTPLDDDSQRTLQDSTVALLERALAGQARTQQLPLDEHTSARLARVQAYVLEHLADSTLTPETLAQTFDMSRRSLYNLFLAGQGTPRAWIQQQRLRRACALLADPAWRGTGVAQIGQACGFADAAHFSRAFAAAQGVAPSAWRQQQAQD